MDISKIKFRVSCSTDEADKLLAPNGKPSNLNSVQYRQVRTPEFKRWFGDWENNPKAASKVLDENGEPLVCYRGTGIFNDAESKGDFDSFNPDLSGGSSNTGAPKGSFFFTNNKSVASSYTVKWRGDFSETYKDAGHVRPVFLNIRKPAKIAAKNNNWREVPYKGDYWSTNDIVQDVMNSSGKDGVIFGKVFDSGVGKTDKKSATTYVVFNPNDIKSAIGNKGTFSPDSDSTTATVLSSNLLAPNGKPSNLTPVQWKMVRLGGFKRWFGDWEKNPRSASKVVDENGEPLPIYYIAEEDEYTPDLRTAKLYAGGNVKQVFLSVKRPLVLDKELDEYELESVIKRGNDGLWMIIDEGNPYEDKRLGGVSYQDKYEGILRVFNQNQVKSATNASWIKAIEDNEDTAEPLLAPNGELSNLTPKQYAQVRTPEFKKWFGDWENNPKAASKVVDENGEPRVVYHGAGSDFNVFVNPYKDGSDGIYFSSSKKFSSKWGQKTGVLKEVFLRIIKPTYNTFQGSGPGALPESTNYDGGIFRKIKSDHYARKGDIEYVVFKSNQVKSATDNSGKFNAKDNDITASLGSLRTRNKVTSSNDVLLAPNGKPSNLTPTQYKQVRTPEFKAWFGDWEKSPTKSSKILDNNGEPQVVHHGTGVEFFVFDKKKAQDVEGRKHGVGTGKGVFSFTTDRDTAGNWAKRSATRGEYGVQHVNPIVMDVWLNIRNPISRDDFQAMLDKKFEGYQFQLPKIRDKFLAEIYRELKAKKVDGIVSSFGEITVIDPRNIKSATKNSGAFNKKSDNILSSVQKYGDATVKTKHATMDGYYGVTLDNGEEELTLPEPGFYIADVWLDDESEKGQGYGQEIYLKALKEYKTLYSTFPTSEDALRVQDRLAEKKLIKIRRISVDDVDFRVLKLAK